MAFKPQLTKRKRILEEDDLVKESPKAQKTVHTTLTVAKAPLSNIESPKLQTFSTKASTPMSCPSIKPAGRSPKSKPCKAFGRRSVGSATRIEPIGKRGVHRAPFSLATALTQSSVKAKAQTRTRNGSWFFDIHVDTEQEEMTNLMQHSTTTLDISDDEGKDKTDGRGKENIPPHELGIVIPQPQQVTAIDSMETRKNMMTEDVRSPLGELATSDYYGVGCNAMSFALVYDDEEPEVVKEGLSLTPSLDFSATATPPSLEPSVITSAVETSPVENNPAVEGEKVVEPTEAEIEIWESGSAAEEATQAAVEGVEVTNIFASA